MIDGEGQANQLMMMMMINGGRGQRLGLWGICRCGYPYMVTYRIRTRAHMHFCTSTELHTTTAEQEKRGLCRCRDHDGRHDKHEGRCCKEIAPDLGALGGEAGHENSIRSLEILGGWLLLSIAHMHVIQDMRRTHLAKRPD